MREQCSRDDALSSRRSRRHQESAGRASSLATRTPNSIGKPMRHAPPMPRLTCSVPPVGVEPTLGTLLGGRPLPLGYGGFLRIPRTVAINARAADYCGLDSESISPI